LALQQQSGQTGDDDEAVADGVEIHPRLSQAALDRAAPDQAKKADDHAGEGRHGEQLMRNPKQAAVGIGETEAVLHDHADDP